MPFLQINGYLIKFSLTDPLYGRFVHLSCFDVVSISLLQIIVNTIIVFFCICLRAKSYIAAIVYTIKALQPSSGFRYNLT